MVKISVLSAVIGLVSVVSAQSCKPTYQQCGGQYYTGSTTCCTGTCTIQNTWYSQCLGTVATTTATTTTSRPATTTTRPATTTTTVPASPTPGGGSTGVAFVAQDLGSATGNPYQGVPRFVPSRYAAKVDTTIANFAGNATRVAKLNKLKTYPTASWLDTMSAISTLQASLTEAGAQGGSKDIIAEYVIYDLPGRDCAADASNGEIPKGGLNTYKTQYIDPIVAIMTNKPSNVILSLIIEPDSLPNIATNLGQLRCDAVSTSEYTEGTAYAVAKLSVLPKTYLYIDAGHGGWLGWPDNQQKMAPIFTSMMTAARAINSAAKIRGFISATSNYSPFNGNGSCPAKEKCPLVDGKYDWNECIDEKLFTAKIGAVFAAAGLPNRWIVDTSRSGRHTIRQYWGSWCNVKGAGLGDTPVTNPAANVDALVWVKPPGDSDGVSAVGAPRLDAKCNPLDSTVSLGASGSDALSGAPQAGQWFEAQLIMLVDNAVPAL